MANFGENLTYWYLRLNGFFPLTNFVVHRTDELRYRADVDMLAIRFKYVYEPVGGHEHDWDDWFIANGLDHRDRITGLIVEVKTGYFSPRTIGNSFSSERLRYAIGRFGFYRRRSTIEKYSDELLTQKSITTKRYRIAKLLVSGSDDQQLPASCPPCLTLSLSHIEQFLVSRMNNYYREKGAARLFFPDELIQYFAWRAEPRNIDEFWEPDPFFEFDDRE